MNDEAELNEESATSEELVNEEVVENEDTEQGQESTYVETDNPNLTKRFGQLTAKAKQAEAKAEQLQARLDKIDSDNLAAELAKPPPTEDQFDYDQEAYGRAVATHFEAKGLAQGKQQARADLQQQQQAQREQQVAESYTQKVQVFAAATPDFMDVIKNLNGLHVGLQKHIQELDSAPEIAYAIGKDPALANQMHQAAVSGNQFALGEMLGQLKRNITSGPKNNVVSKAGKPIQTPIQSGVSSSDSGKYQHSSGATFD
jgi:hypothetical protein